MGAIERNRLWGLDRRLFACVLDKIDEQVFWLEWGPQIERV